MRIIAGEARGRRILVPHGEGTRPPLERMREAIFSILDEGSELSRVLDLFAGSGAFGLEALSRGARQATFVERDPVVVRLLARNIRDLGFAGRACLIQGDALAFPPHGMAVPLFDAGGRHRGAPGRPVVPLVPEGGEAGDPYDLVFLDPPFPMFQDPCGGAEILRRSELLLQDHVTPGGSLILRHPAAIPVEPLRQPSDRREFGESIVLFFEKP